MRYLSLAEYLWLAEQVTGFEAAVLSKAARIDLVWCPDPPDVDGADRRSFDYRNKVRILGGQVHDVGPVSPGLAGMVGTLAAVHCASDRDRPWGRRGANHRVSGVDRDRPGATRL